jgi:hypothetical protein
MDVETILISRSSNLIVQEFPFLTFPAPLRLPQRGEKGVRLAYR